LRTPAKRELVVPNAALAAAIAEEWRAQGAEIRPRTMPLTRLAATALDRTAVQRDATLAETANYAGTDLVCYRADHPPELAARQHRAWQGLIDWAAARYGARLEVTEGVIPKRQQMAVLNAFAAALAENHIGHETAFAVSQLDETFQIEAWGEDAEAAERRRGLAADIEAAARFLALLREGAE